MKPRVSLFGILGLLVSACAATPGPGPALSGRAQATATVQETAPITFRIVIPPRSALKVSYTSASTQSIEITFPTGSGRVVQNITGAGPYNITFEAPLGNETYTITLFDLANAAGNALATQQTSFTVTRGAANTPNVTLFGIPNSMVLGLADPTPLIDGVGKQIAVTLTVLDAGSNTITGTYQNTPTVTASGAASGLGLLTTGNPANTAVAVPTDTTTVNVAYTGGGSQGDVVSYTATANTTQFGLVTSNTITLTPKSDIRFPANGDSDTITPTFISFATQNIDVKQVNGTLPTASGCAGIASTVMTEDASGDYNAAVTPTNPGGGTCTITLTGAVAGGVAQTGTINFSFSP